MTSSYYCSKIAIEMGLTFETWVFDRLSEFCFSLKDPKSGKEHKDEHHNRDVTPDLMMEYNGFQFHVECYWRSRRPKSDRIKLEQQDANFDLKKRCFSNLEDPVIVILGLEGKPDNPEHLAVFPVGMASDNIIKLDTVLSLDCEYRSLGLEGMIVKYRDSLMPKTKPAWEPAVVNDWEDLESLTHDELVIECAHQRWLMENLKANLVILAYEEGCFYERFRPQVVTDEWARKLIAYIVARSPEGSGPRYTDAWDMGVSMKVADPAFQKYCEETGYELPDESEELHHLNTTVWEELDRLDDDTLIIRIVETRNGLACMKAVLPRLSCNTGAYAWLQQPDEEWMRKILRYLCKITGGDRGRMEDMLSDYGAARDQWDSVYNSERDYDTDDILDEMCPKEPRRKEEGPKHISGKPLAKVTNYPRIGISSDILAMSRQDMIMEIVRLSVYLSDLRCSLNSVKNKDHIPISQEYLFYPSVAWFDRIMEKSGGPRRMCIYGVSVDAVYARSDQGPGWFGYVCTNKYDEIAEDLTADPWRYLDIQDDGYLRYRLTVLREKRDKVKAAISTIMDV